MSSPSPQNFAEQLDNCNRFSEIFEVVKRAVKTFLKKHRSGLMLGLADLGMRKGYFIGAFHPIGSNIIVLNRTPLERAFKQMGRRLFNAYCFHLLLHEYLHSLGYVDEDEVRRLTLEVCRLALGPKHPATLMAERGITHFFPKVRYFTLETAIPEDIHIELIKDFDRSSTHYIH